MQTATLLQKVLRRSFFAMYAVFNSPKGMCLKWNCPRWEVYAVFSRSDSSFLIYQYSLFSSSYEKKAAFLSDSMHFSMQERGYKSRFATVFSIQ